MDWPALYFDHLNGPVPICFVAHQSLLASWSTGIWPSECFGSIQTQVSPSSSAALGFDVVMVTVCGSTTLTPVTSVAVPALYSAVPAIAVIFAAALQPPFFGLSQSSM